jgi:hypothetical protein
MSTVTLTRVDLVAAQGDPWIAAIMADFYIPKGARVFVGNGLDAAERVVFFIGADGGGTGYIDRDPAGYVESSKHMAAAVEYEAIYGCWPESDGTKHAAGPEGYEFEAGSFNPKAREIVQKASMSLF